MKKKLLLLPVLLAGAGALYWWTQGPGQTPAEEVLTRYGNVDIREVDLAFGTSEHIGELLVQEGDRVQPGQVLGRLHTEKLEVQVAAAQAAVDAQAQALARLEAGSRPEEIRRAGAQADALKAKARTAQITYERQRKLALQKLSAPEAQTAGPGPYLHPPLHPHRRGLRRHRPRRILRAARPAASGILRLCDGTRRFRARRVTDRLRDGIGPAAPPLRA